MGNENALEGWTKNELSLCPLLSVDPLCLLLSVPSESPLIGSAKLIPLRRRPSRNKVGGREGLFRGVLSDDSTFIVSSVLLVVAFLQSSFVLCEDRCKRDLSGNRVNPVSPRESSGVVIVQSSS